MSLTIDVSHGKGFKWQVGLFRHMQMPCQIAHFICQGNIFASVVLVSEFIHFILFVSRKYVNLRNGKWTFLHLSSSELHCSGFDSVQQNNIFIWPCLQRSLHALCIHWYDIGRYYLPKCILLTHLCNLPTSWRLEVQPFHEVLSWDLLRTQINTYTARPSAYIYIGLHM